LYVCSKAYRIGNAVDRPMNRQARILYAMQYLHGTMGLARQSVRSMALVRNFHPYGTKTGEEGKGRLSPSYDFNRFSYHEN
jgi:hypothetical protein